MRSSSFWLLGAAALLSAACGGSPSTTSTVSGTIAQATFPAPVQAITVVDDHGGSFAVGVDAAGAFQVTLTQGASYRLLLSENGASLPIVLNSASGRLETQIAVQSGGAAVDLGQVRYWAGAGSTARAKILGGLVTPTPSASATTSASCVGGTLAGTAEPCASGEAAVVCESGMDHGGGKHGGMHGGGHSGVDPTDPATDASANEPVGVPERNLTPTLDCGCVGMGH